MSGFGGGGFGGFGQQNNQLQQGAGFGGSGFANTPTPSFGQPANTTTTTFGAANPANPGGGIFGQNNANATSTFGASNTNSFGSNNQQAPLFGANKPATFGQSTSTQLFGGTAATTSAPSFGGFGATSANTSTFGASATPQSSSLFNSQAKPAPFASTGLFGQAGFGTTNTTTTNAFGAPSGTALNQPVPPSDGTAKIPFQAKIDKENNATIHYQNIACQEPYNSYSQEELRVADYLLGRRFGNASNQPGQFGLGSSFGNFGQTQNQTQSAGFGTNNTSTNLFGNSNTTSNPFGTNQTTTSLGGGGLFGNAPKSSAPSLFNPTSTAPATAPLFGGSALNSTNTFGGGTSNLFGGAATTKPGGLFGSQTTSAFAPSNSMATSNPFGNSSSAPFGQQQQQNAPSTGLFGQQPQQQQQGQATGTNAFSTGFGQQNQQANNPFGPKPQQPQTSLFSNQPAGNAFSTSTQQPGGGLFGNQQQQQQEPPKQGLFGNTPFGNTQSQSSSLFGNNPVQPAKPSLFGNPQQQQPTGGLFGNNPTNTNGSSLFSNANQNQQQQGSSFLGSGNSSSMFANSQQQQQNPLALSQPGTMHSDLLGNNVYGSPSIFSGLPQPSSVHSGPVATPLRTPASLKKRDPLPLYKSSSLNPNRMLSPMKKGYGFSYGSYGSPATPGSTPNSSLSSGSLLGGSFGRSLGRATSLTNLRRSFDTDQPSVLAPGAFSLGRNAGHNVKRLDINRSLKVQPLFASPTSSSPSTLSPTPIDTYSQTSRLKKRVSFDDGALGSRNPSETNDALIPTETSGPEPTAEELGFLRSRRGNDLNGVNNGGRGQLEPREADSRQPNMEQIRGNELAIVPEDDIPPPPPTQKKRPGDPEPGEYWSKPSIRELLSMSPADLKQVRNFEVGRQGCGYVHFDQPVDLTGIRLDALYGGVVVIDVRIVTVYTQSSRTPPVGSGLNVPSTIVLENSWARSKTYEIVKANAQRIEQHVAKLKKTKNTHFVNFEPRNGLWTFRVDHFTTYEMYDDDDTELESLNQSTLSAPPDTPTPKNRTPTRQDPVETAEETSSEESDLEDTYDFKKKVFPGAFDREAAFEEDDEMEQEETINEPFLEDGSTGSPFVHDQESINSEEESGSDEEMEMAGAFPKPITSVEQENASPFKWMFSQSQQPQWTPGKVPINFESTWAEQLQRTVSPKKQDRDALREIQGNALIDIEPESSTKSPSKEVKNKGFRNSIDLMNSLFGKHEQQRLSRKQSVEGKGFEWPYSKKPKTFAGDGTDMSDADIAFHQSFKSTFTPRDAYLLLKPKGTVPQTKASMPETHLRTVGNFELMTKSLISKKNFPDLKSGQMHFQKDRTSISDFEKIPFAEMEHTSFLRFASFVDNEHAKIDPLVMQEKQIWELAFILFDDFEDEISAGVPDELRDELADRIRKDRLCRFWQGKVVKEKVAKDLAKNMSREEDAIVHLTAGNVKAACEILFEAKDFHLATLVAQAPGDHVFREGIRSQIDEWRAGNMLSEMTDPIRALYEILTGNACKVEGVKGQIVDRASEFIISERFNLSWQQAFALRLWYVIYEDEPLEEAIISFDNDIMSFADSAWPSPYDDEKRKDIEAQKAEWLISPLWTLLQIYAASKSHPSKFNPSVELPAQIMPKTITGDIFNTRLTFQLYHALCARKRAGECKFRTSATLSDQLTVDFASQIAASGQFIFAALVFLYLTDPDERCRAIKELLARNAPSIPERDSNPMADDIWSSLCGDLLLPEPWIWEALALHARSYRNCDVDALDELGLAHAVAPFDEVRYLLEAENWDEAHTTLCRVVAPMAVIERDYETLVTLLLGFQGQPEHTVKGWEVGGAIYLDFVNIMLNRLDENDKAGVLQELVEGLIRMRGKSGMVFEESVAMREMAGVVAGLVGEESDKNKAVVPTETILRMPLTGDVRMRKALEAGLGYYGGVMAGS